MRAIAYLRCSTEDQASEGVSIEVQAESVRRYALYKGMTLVETIEDAGVSGGINKARAGFIRLLDRVQAGDVDAIILHSLERLSRDMLTLLALERLLNENDVALHTVEGEISTSDPNGWMNFAMRAFMGELERRVVKSRTKKAMAHKKGQGHVTGAVCYGYSEKTVEVPGREKPLKVLESFEPEQAVIREVNRLYKEGARLVAIVKHLNNEGISTREGTPWCATQVKRLISDYHGSFKKTQTRLTAATRAFIEAIA